MPREFEAIELPEPIKKGAKNVTRKGKKSIAWDQDPEILKRLTRVAELMLDGKYSWQIAEELRCSIATAKRDIKRVRELWKTTAKEDLEDLYNDSIATYKRAQLTAWNEIRRDPKKAAQLLGVILDAQKQKERLSGLIKPEPVEVNISGEVVVRDIQTVREERWNQVMEMMKDVVPTGEQK